MRRGRTGGRRARARAGRGEALNPPRGGAPPPFRFPPPWMAPAKPALEQARSRALVSSNDLGPEDIVHVDDPEGAAGLLPGDGAGGGEGRPHLPRPGGPP